MSWFFSKSAAAAPAGSDDFNRADADALGTASGGGTWTEHAGDSDISSNTAVIVSGSFTDCINTNSTNLGSVTQYIKATCTGASFDYHYFIFRFTNSSSPFYVLQFYSGPGAEWQRWASVGGAIDVIDPGLGLGGVFNVGDSVGFTIEGTGNSTVLRVWIRPTANAPTTAALWDGAGPAHSFTADPASPVDTGNFTGFGGSQSTASQLAIDNFFSGGL